MHQTWRSVIESTISRSDIFILILSTGTLTPEMTTEIRQAFQRNKTDAKFAILVCHHRRVARCAEQLARLGIEVANLQEVDFETKEELAREVVPLIETNEPVGGIRFTRNFLYNHLSPPLKIALSVLEAGILTNEKGNITYDPKRVAWLSKISRDLAGQTSRGTIDRHLESLLDESMLSHGETVMVHVVDDNIHKWVRGYHVANEYVEQLIKLYKLVHEAHDPRLTS